MTEGRAVIVTGAAGALGQAVLTDLTAAGWRVIAFAREGSLGRLDPASHHLALPVNLLDAAAVRAAIDEAAARMGGLHALLCLAGGSLMGVLGALIALPLAVIVHTLLMELVVPLRQAQVVETAIDEAESEVG